MTDNGKVKGEIPIFVCPVGGYMMQITNRIRYLARLAGLMILVSSLCFTGCNRRRRQPQARRRIPEVSVVILRTQKITLTTELPGRTSAFRVAEIRPQVCGLLLKRLFREGSDVKEGQVLYRIDPREFQAALDNAVAALGKAEANLPSIRARVERYGKLLETKAVSQQAYDDALSALKQAEAEIKYWKAQVKTARINLNYCRITAPISGRIGRSFITEGAVVTAYQPRYLAVIQQLDPIYVDVTQSTAELLRLKRRLEEGLLRYNGSKDNNVKLVLEDGTTYPHSGTLQFRDVTVDPTTGSVVLRILFKNPDHVLLPGMFVRAIITEGTKSDAILVPQEGVTEDRKGNHYAMIVNRDNLVEMRPIKIDRAIGNRWLVASGLSPGDRVIVEGLQFIRPGMPVKIVPAGKKSGQKSPSSFTKSGGGR